MVGTSRQAGAALVRNSPRESAWLLALATAGLSVIAMMVPPSARDIGPAPWNGTPSRRPDRLQHGQHHQMG